MAKKTKPAVPKPVVDEVLVNAFHFRLREAIDGVWMHVALPDHDKQEILARTTEYLRQLK
jgi:hypothetical protein